jgi:hypothetical protein
LIALAWFWASSSAFEICWLVSAAELHGAVKTAPYKISRKLSDAGKRTVCRGDIHVSRVPFHRRQRPGRDKSLPYKTTTKAL